MQTLSPAKPRGLQGGLQALSQSGVLIGIVALVLFFSLRSPFFFSIENFLNIGVQSALLMVAAFAMTFIIISGEIDLSIGAVVSLIGILVALALRDGAPVWLALLVAATSGIALGTINGAVTVIGRIPSFIVTLGMYSIARGISFGLTNARAISVQNAQFLAIFADAAPLGIPMPIWIAVVTLGVLNVVLSRTVFGSAVFAVGGNREAARLAGMAVTRIKIGVFALAGLLSGLAAVVLTARLGTGFVEGGRNLELDAIAAVVLGGTSFTGGRGSLLRTVLGALLIGILNNGLTLLNVNFYLQLVVKGTIIILAVLLDRWGNAKRG